LREVTPRLKHQLFQIGGAYVRGSLILKLMKLHERESRGQPSGFSGKCTLAVWGKVLAESGEETRSITENYQSLRQMKPLLEESNKLLREWKEDNEITNKVRLVGVGLLFLDSLSALNGWMLAKGGEALVAFVAIAIITGTTLNWKDSFPNASLIKVAGKLSEALGGMKKESVQVSEARTELPATPAFPEGRFLPGAAN